MKIPLKLVLLNKSNRKTIENRNSSINENKHDLQTSTLPSQNLGHLPLKTRSNVKHAQIALYHFAVMNNSLVNPKKKLSTSTSHVDYEYIFL